ncbi:MAG: flagellar basal body P-ring protein FlgI [Deltaproteobacteria bacterium]|nr:flagellar basal body P-ring protein FlgI [Deltaproteobacteria bacterium]MBW2015439.1 flagellar basal body P-ring protein FlgI [Deltaproteobacteria bacterium]MBW2129193.1 flagellar basal body P-ring protein FlgI [Deltaproteobacteria bacterium]MBW2302807.1 flagellar basal body P-ring protein FlgI [Deltaproteobacteria bacterium]
MRSLIRFSSALILGFAFLLMLGTSPASAARIKDIASLKGVRSNQLVGYGLVVGLNGTGDGSGTKFTIQSLVNMMERLGIHVLADQVKVANVAAVMVTADLPPFSRVGSRMDVLVSSIGDAKSLQGGTLLLTPLKGVDNRIYALAQGPLIVGGFSSSGQAGGGVQKNHPTVARIPDGATIEREIPFDFNRFENLTIALHQPDFTTALRVSEAINRQMNGEWATPADAGTIRVRVPDSYRGNLVGLVASLEQLNVEPDMKAKIIVDERTGTVIMGEDVRISSVAIAHGNLSVQIKEDKRVSQPTPFSAGQTVVTDQSQVNVTEEQNRLILMPGGTRLGELVKALNAIGVSPRDLIAVFQAIKASGALQAELEIM